MPKIPGKRGLPEYTFVIIGKTLAEEFSAVQRAANDDVAIDMGGRMLGPEHLEVNVGRGSCGQVKWLGAWEWRDGQRQWAADVD